MATNNAATSTTQNVDFLIDSGSTSHWAANIDNFINFDPSANTVFTMADGTSTLTSHGTGDIQFNARSTTGKMYKVTIHDVHFSPDMHNNILSVQRMIDYDGFNNPDFKSRTLTAYGLSFPLLTRQQDCQPVWRVTTTTTSPGLHHQIATITGTNLTRDVTNWRYLTAEYEKFSRMTSRNPNGLSDTDCCSDDNNKQTVNIAHYTIRNPYQTHCLAGYSNYCNPVYTHEEITKFLTKAAADFELDPINTSFLVILPYWPQAPWWHMTKLYTELHRYDKGSEIFTAPTEGTYNTHQLHQADITEGTNRVFIQGTPWPVSVFHRDNHTIPVIDNNMLLHLRFGHLGATHLTRLLDSGVNIGLTANRDQLLRQDPLCSCAPCRLAKASRPGPHHPRDQQQPQNTNILKLSTDLIGPVEPAGYDGTRYLIGFAVLNYSFVKLYSLKSKDQSLEKLNKFIAWLGTHPFKDTHTSTQLHLDNDSVFTSDEFKRTCEKNKILLTWAAPYVAQTNCRIEVVWRDSTRMALAYLIQSSLQYHYWPLAYHHAVNIRNTTPQRHLGYNIPHSLAFGSLPDLSRVRIFGCTAFAWIHDDNRKKLDDRALELRYVGHKDLHGSPHQYLLLNVNTGVVRNYAKPVFKEALDEQSKRLVQVDLDGMLPTLTTQFGRLQPSPWSTANVSRRDRRILDLIAYYDEEDHETLACVQFVAHSHPRGAWTTVRNYLASGSGAYQHLQEFVKHFDRLGRLSSLFPLFASVEARIGHRYEPAVIIAVDVSRTDFDDTSYTVAAEQDEGLQPIDLPVKQVRFGSSARGRRATAALVPLESTPSSSSTSSTTPPTAAVTLDKVPFYESYITYTEPLTLAQARLFPDAAHWDAAVGVELYSLEQHGVLMFMEQAPAGAKLLGTKWVFKLKKKHGGTLDKYRARLVAKGYLQRPGVDYSDTFAPGTQLSSFRVLLILATNFNLDLEHLDVKTAFLNSELKETIYVRLPEDATSQDGHTVAKLHKSIYGLKQAGHDWHECSETFILAHDNRLRRSSVEPCLYYLYTNELKILILTHVDDYIVASSSRAWTLDFIKAFNTKFGVNVLGKLSHFMQMAVDFTDTETTLSQQRTIDELAAEYHMLNCKPNTVTPLAENINLNKLETFDPQLPYRNLLGSLLWLARGTRPDISYAVSYLSQFCNCYGEEHFTAARRVLKYLIATKEKKLILPVIKHKKMVMDVYSDSDWAGEKTDRKSVSGTVIFLNGAPVTWTSKKQSIVATSSTEAEYIAASESVKDMLYTHNLLKEFITIATPITMHIDNTGAINLSEKNLNNQRTKHIDIRYHHIRDWVQSKVVKIEKVRSIDNIADLFTKPLPARLHEHHSATFVREFKINM